jgi:hypothetical protein
MIKGTGTTGTPQAHFVPVVPVVPVPFIIAQPKKKKNTCCCLEFITYGIVRMFIFTQG